MTIRILLFIIASLFFASHVLAQNPIANFTASATACRDELLSIANTSTNADAYAWDFCPDDMATFVSNNQAIDVSGLFSDQYGYAIVEDNGQWHAFLTSRFQDRLYRLDFGNSLENTPTIVNLNNPGNLLAAPEGIDFSKVSGNWYAFVGSLNSLQGIRRLDFGSSLTNTPTAIDIGNFGTSRIRSLKVIKSNADNILVLCDYSGNSITTINYRDSFDNSTTGFVSTTGVIPGITNPFGIDLVKNGNDWIGLVASYNSNSLLQLNFGTDIQSVPAVEATVSFTEIARPTNVKVIYEAGSFFGLVSNETAAMAVIDLKDLNPVNTPSIVSHVGLPPLTWLDAVRVNGVDYVQGIGNLSTSVRNLIFKSDCGTTLTFSTDQNPSGLKYTTAGSKKIELQASNNTSSETSTHFETVVVTADIAPDIDFTTNGFVCENSLVEFTAINVSGGVASYDWNFGDTNVDSGPLVQHGYAPGTYTISASANGSNGCINVVSRDIQIYAAPSPDFTIPGGTLCTNGEQNFVNATTDSFDGNLTYQWFVDNQSESNSRDLQITFTTTGTKEIRLETAIPGCTTSVTKVTSSLETGPVIEFVVEGKCLNETTTITSSSTDDIVNYLWDFDDGQTSTDANPSLLFAAVGDYSIKLEAESTNGCISTLTQPWTIYSLPVPDFTASLPPFSCVGLPVEFMDNTPDPVDSDVDQWLWDFGSMGSTSILQHPTFTYSSIGDYSVSLMVTTNQGCSGSSSIQIINIATCPLAIAAFIAPSTACQDQPLEFTNTSSNTNQYEWDFCPNDLEAEATSSDLVTIGGLLSEFHGYKLIVSNNQWYGFLTSRSQNKMYRFDFGSDPESTPLVVDLGNPGGLLSEPEGVDIVENNGNWFGFVGSLTSSYGIVRLDFGNSLENAPTALNIGAFGSSRARSVKVLKQEDDFILVVVDYGGNALIRVNYRDSFSNDVTGFIYNSGVLNGSVNSYAIDFVKKDFEWTGILTSYNDNSLLQLSFGADILSVPTVMGDYPLAGLSKPTHIRIIEEAGGYRAVVGNDQGNFQIVNFYDLETSNPPDEITHAELTSLSGLDIFRIAGKDVLHGIAKLDSKLKIFFFEENCSASVAVSDQEQPPIIYYSSSGDKIIQLTASSISTGAVSVTSRTVQVSAESSPSIDFSKTGSICSSSPVTFLASSAGSAIVEYQWSFGDSNSGQGISIQHTYVAGTYTVRLDVEATNGCTSFKEDVQVIYNPPASSFTLPTGLICTNNEFTFVNNTVDNFDGNLTYQWLVDATPVSNDRDLLYTFDSGGSKEIKLQASIPGCTSESIQTLANVGEGPIVNFSIDGNCLNESIQFNNSSSGDIAGFAWDFGNGETSSDPSYALLYSTAGIFDIELQTLGTNGCTSTKVVSHQIYSVPQPAFNIDLPPFSCNDSPTQFNNLTPPLADSNLDTWQWNFGDNSASDTAPTPQHTYDLSGTYSVTLTAVSDQGCSNQIIQDITISEAPTPVITTSPVCVDVGVELHETSGIITSAWQWQIGNTFYFTEAPSHVFELPGNYTIDLLLTGENGCIGTAEKQVNIPDPLIINFESIKKCVGTEAEFTAFSGGSSDLAATYTWDFGDEEKQGGVSTYSFATEGLHEVLLIVTTESGCSYSINKAVTILPDPQADFSFTPSNGAPPLAVQFTNLSTNASTYSWNFNDAANSNSTDPAPLFTFTEIGDYPVDLHAFNEEECESTQTRLVSVALPFLSVSLENFELVKTSDGSIHLLSTLQNRGNVNVQNLVLEIGLSNGTQLRETLRESLVGGEQRIYELTTSIGSAYDLQFVCLKIILDNNATDAVQELCITLEEATIFTTPYPNPATDLLVLEWVSATDETIWMKVITHLGKEVQSKSLTAREGLNTQILHTQNWQSGLYFVTLRSGTIERTFRTIIAR